MSEFCPGEVLEQYLDKVARIEKNKLELERLAILRDNMFHDAFFHSTPMVHVHIAEQNFLNEKEDIRAGGGNFGDIFALGISDEYLGKIKLIELSNTDDPSEIYAEDAKEPYKDLRQWLVTNEVIEREMTREESGRSFSHRISDVAPPDGSKIEKRYIVTRERPLIVAQMENEQKTSLEFVIAKTMVFSVPAIFLQVILDCRSGEEEQARWTEEAMSRVENLLHELNSPDATVIQKLRTGYYLQARPLNEDPS